MPTHSLNRWIAFAVLAGALQTGAALAQSAPTAWSVGYSTDKLTPTNGVDQRMNGFALGGEHPITSDLSLEASLNRQTGTQTDTVTGGTIDMRQLGALGGLKATVVVNPKVQWFTHFLIGVQQLKASEGSASDQRTAPAFGMGLGLDLAIAPHLSVRAQQDFICTRYAGDYQTGATFFMGLVIRR